MGRDGPLRPAAGGRRGPAEVRPARWAPLCQRRDTHRPCGQQGAQGHHRQEPGSRRLRRALCPGLGLPRPAHRAAGGEEGRTRGPEGGCRGIPQGLPRICRPAGRAPAPGLQATGRARRLGPALPDNGLSIRGRYRPRPRPHRCPGSCAEGLQAGALVHRLRLGLGRGRGRIQGQELLCHRCALPARRSGGPAGPLSPWPRRVRQRPGLPGDLDDHALDAPGESGGRPEPGPGVRHRRVRRAPGARAPDHRRPPAQGGDGPLRHQRLPGQGLRAGGRSGRGAATAPVLCSAGPGDPRRARHPGCGHGGGAHRARPWSRGLHRRPALRFARGQPRRGRRALSRGHRDVRRSARAQRQREGHRRAQGPGHPGARGAFHPQLSPLLAAQDADYLPRYSPVVHQHGAGGAARGGPARDRRGSLAARLGQGADRGDGREPSGLVHLAPAHLGRADRAVRPASKRGPASRDRPVDRGGGPPGGRGRRGGLVCARSTGAAWRRCRAVREGARHPGRSGSTPG